MKFRMKQYEKDRKKCYEMSKNGINLGSLSKTEERISSQRIKTVIKRIYGPVEVRELFEDAEKCDRRDPLGLCLFHVKDRQYKKCEYCEVNV